MGVYDNWVTHAEWTASTSITKFTTVWEVPPAPSSSVKVFNGGKRNIFLFNALTYTEHVKGTDFNKILQPVLTFGENGNIAGTGEWWSIQSWFAGSQDPSSPFEHTKPAVKVFPGDVLLGEMTQTLRSDGKCDLVCVFKKEVGTEITDTRLEIIGRDITAQNVCQLALEVYHAASPQAYPNVFRTAMRKNHIWAANNVELQPNWTPKEQNFQFWGEHCAVTKIDNPSAVDLCYGFGAPPSIALIAGDKNVVNAFGVDHDGHLAHCTVTDGKPAWQVVQGIKWTSPPTVVSAALDIIDVLGLGPGDNGNRNVNQAQWVRFTKGTASSLKPLGENFSCNVAAIVEKGQINIFGVLVGGLMAHSYIGADGNWSGKWEKFEEGKVDPPKLFMASPIPVQYAPSKIKLLGLSVDRNTLLEHEFQGQAGQGWDIAGLASYCNPSILQVSDTHLALFTIQPDNRDRMQLLYKLAEKGSWESEFDISMPFPPGGPPVAISTIAGSVDIFILDKAGSLWHRSGKVGDEIEWHDWEKVPFAGQIVTSLPSLIALNPSTVQVFVRNAKNELLAKKYAGGKWAVDEVLGGDISGF